MANACENLLKEMKIESMSSVEISSYKNEYSPLSLSIASMTLLPQVTFGWMQANGRNHCIDDFRHFELAI